VSPPTKVAKPQGADHEHIARDLWNLTLGKAPHDRGGWFIGERHDVFYPNGPRKVVGPMGGVFARRGIQEGHAHAIEGELSPNIPSATSRNLRKNSIAADYDRFDIITDRCDPSLLYILAPPERIERRPYNEGRPFRG
jgi:hypothetical protein